MAESLTELLERVSEVCPLPATSQRVLALTSDEHAGIPQIAGVILSDPALAAAVLRVANSAAYGTSRTAELEVALLRLGMRELHELAGAMCILAAFRSRSELSLQLHDAGVVAGAIAHRLAKETGKAQPSTAFTCGLLGEVGAMVCLTALGQRYVDLFKTNQRDPVARRAAELNLLGVSSFEVGQAFLLRNSMPEPLAEAVGAAWETLTPASPVLCRISVVARRCPGILTGLGRGVKRPDVIAELDQLCQLAAWEPHDGVSLFETCVKAGAVAERALRSNR